MNIVDANRDNLIELCEKHKVKELYLFGSILTDKFNASSDIDMLIQFNKINLLDYFDNYMELKEELEAALEEYDIKVGNVLRRPIDGLIQYHILNK